MIKFEKKIIIGSIASFIITSIGTIAIFFPSVFNLEKENFGKEISIVIHEDKDFNDLFVTLSKLDYKEKKIFPLEIHICHPNELPYFQGDWTEDFLSIENNNMNISIGEARNSKQIKAEYWRLIQIQNLNDFKYLPEHSNLMCTKNTNDDNAGEKDSIVIKTYTMPIDYYSPHAEEEIIVLKNIPEEQIKLKKY